MKKDILIIIIIAASLAAGCHSGTSSGGREAVHTAGITPTDAFYTAIDSVMAAYYQLRDAITAADTSLADTAAGKLNVALEHIPLEDIRSDTARQEAGSTVNSLGGEIAGLQGEDGIKGRREEFSIISDMLYDLVKTVGLKHHTVYRDFCPMAFDKGAYWLSSDTVINNPYYGKSMPDCGEVKEKLAF